MDKRVKLNREKHDKTIEREVLDRGTLPSRLYGYYGGILGGNIGGLMTTVHDKEELEEKK